MIFFTSIFVTESTILTQGFEPSSSDIYIAIIKLNQLLLNSNVKQSKLLDQNKCTLITYKCTHHFIETSSKSHYILYTNNVKYP